MNATAAFDSYATGTGIGNAYADADPDDLGLSVEGDEEDEYPPLTMPKEEVVDRQAIAYLLRYETMVRQQEAEDMATMAHIKPLLMRLEALSDTPLQRSMSVPDMQREMSFLQLQQAADNLMDDEYMTTDRQFILVLQTLTQKHQRYSSPLSASPHQRHNNDNNDDMETPKVTYAEFVQCYKAVVAGMQALQHLQGCDAARARARDRTLAVLSLFESPSTKLLDEGSSTSIGSSGSADEGVPKVVRALEMNVDVGGGMMSRFHTTTATTTNGTLQRQVKQRKSSLVGIMASLVTVGFGVVGTGCAAAAGFAYYRPDLVEPWKIAAVEHLLQMWDLELPPSLSSSANRPVPTPASFISATTAVSATTASSVVRITDAFAKEIHTEPPTPSTTKTHGPILESIYHASNHPVNPQTPIQPLLQQEENLTVPPPFQQQHQQRRQIYAAVGGAAGMAAAPFVMRLVPVFGKFIATTVATGGLGAWSILTIGSSILLQLVFQGIESVFDKKRRN